MLKLLPASWQSHSEKVGLTELSNWQKEQRELEAKRTEERGKQLQQARHNLEMLQRDYQALELDEAKYPAEAQQETGGFAKSAGHGEACNKVLATMRPRRRKHGSRCWKISYSSAAKSRLKSCKRKGT